MHHRLWAITVGPLSLVVVGEVAAVPPITRRSPCRQTRTRTGTGGKSGGGGKGRGRGSRAAPALVPAPALAPAPAPAAPLPLCPPLRRGVAAVAAPMAGAAMAAAEGRRPLSRRRPHRGHLPRLLPHPPQRSPSRLLRPPCLLLRHRPHPLRRRRRLSPQWQPLPPPPSPRRWAQLRTEAAVGGARQPQQKRDGRTTPPAAGAA